MKIHKMPRETGMFHFARVLVLLILVHSSIWLESLSLFSRLAFRHSQEALCPKRQEQMTRLCLGLTFSTLWTMTTKASPDVRLFLIRWPPLPLFLMCFYEYGARSHPNHSSHSLFFNRGQDKVRERSTLYSSSATWHLYTHNHCLCVCGDTLWQHTRTGIHEEGSHRSIH